MADSYPTQPSGFSSERYFSTQSPPQKLAEEIDAVRKFITFHAHHDRQRRIVLITSGGTTVPLEHNVVRFLDNFSAGTRGSASAEYFLRSNQYAVIFLHRSHSLQPFSRHYPHSTNPFLDLLDVEPSAASDEGAQVTGEQLFPRLSASADGSAGAGAGAGAEADGQRVTVAAAHRGPLETILHAHHLVRGANLLHTISFVTVNEYLYLLRAVAQVLGEPALGLGRRAMLYLAAAVSDFFIPEQKLSEHKIQSGKGSLVIEMDAVPKVLKDVTSEWSNQAFIVSFKLETDSALLVPKAKTALERYGHHLVIANELHSRKKAVLMIDREGTAEPVELKDNEVGVVEIEEEMVNRLLIKHTRWIEARVLA